MADGDNFLPRAQLTASGRPVLHPGEIEASLVSSVDLLSEENPDFPHLTSGLLTLTNHRLLWLPSYAADLVYIPLSTVSHIFSFKKSLKYVFSNPRIRFQVSVSTDGKVDKKGVKSMVITLIFRGKSDPETFLGRFLEAWKGRAWEENEVGSGGAQPGQSSRPASGEGSLAVRMPVVGVAGILRKEQEMWESTDKSLQDAFQDLNALMVC